MSARVGFWLSVLLFVGLQCLYGRLDAAPSSSMGWNDIPVDNIKDMIAHIQCLTGSSVDSNGWITTPGYYRLSGNVTGPVIITSSSVTLDLNRYVISNTSGTGSCGILVDNGTDVTIKNGGIGPIYSSRTSNPVWGGRGLAIVAASSSIIVQNLQIFGCAENGVDISQSSNIVINNCSFDSCKIGCYANQSAGLQATDCQAGLNRLAGFALFNCMSSNLSHCLAIDNGSTGTLSAYGFVSSGGTNNYLDSCSAQGTTAALTTTIGIDNPLAKMAAGIVLQDFENGSIVQNSVISNTQGLFGASAYGLLLKNKSFVPTTSGLSVNLALSNVTVVAWNPDGTHVAIGTSGAAANELYVYLFDGTSLTTSVQPATSIANISTATWSPDGRYLAVGTNNSLYLYYYNGQALIGPASVASATMVNSVSWSPDGHYLAVAAAPSDLALYAWNGQTLNAVFIPTIANANTVAFSPSGSYLAVGKTAGSSSLGVCSWNKKTATLGSFVDSSPLVTTAVNSISWNSNEQALVVGLTSTPSALSVYAFNGQSLSLTSSQDVSNMTVNTVSWSPDRSHIAAGTSTTFSAYTWNGRTFAGTSTQIAMTNVSSVAWSPNAQNLLVGRNALNPAVSMYGWDGAMITSSYPQIVTMPTTSTARAVAWHPTGKTIALGSSSNTGVSVYSWNGALLGAAVSQSITYTVINALAWSPDGKTLMMGGDTATASRNLVAYPWNGSFLGTVVVPTALVGPALSLSWNPNGQFLAVGGSFTNYVFVYPWTGAAFGSRVSTTPVVTGTVNAASWSPDGKFLAIGGNFTNHLAIYPWNGAALGTAKTIVPSALVPIVYSVAWNPNGKILAVGCDSGNYLYLYSWNGISLVQFASYSSLGGLVRSVAWSPDGQYLAVGGDFAGYLKIYPWDGTSLGSPLSPLVTISGPVCAVSWAPDGQSLAVAGGVTSPGYFNIYPWSNSPSNCAIKNIVASNTLAPTSGLGFGIFGSAFADIVNNNQVNGNTINYGGGVCNIRQGYSTNNLTVSNDALQNVSMP